MKKFLFLMAALLVMALPAVCQNEAVADTAAAKPKPLFQYPVAPDTMKTLEARTNYVTAHFWDEFDVSKPIRDKAGFEQAFHDYLEVVKLSNPNVMLASVRNLMNHAQSNLPNFLYIADLAERSLYDQGAEYYSDEVYMPFIQSVMESKRVKSDEKERYKIQLEKMGKNAIGQPAPDFEFTDVNGNKQKLSDIHADVVLLFFNTRDCEDCSIARTRLSTDVTINSFISKGNVKIVSITPDGYSTEWAESAKKDADNWIIGASDKADEIFDIRLSPSFYVLDKDGKILNKNVPLEGVKYMFNE
jgi:peroxiredoxin